MVRLKIFLFLLLTAFSFILQNGLCPARAGAATPPIQVINSAEHCGSDSCELAKGAIGVKPDTAKIPALPLHATVKMYADQPTLFINGKRFPPFAYMSYLGEEKYYKEAAAASIHIYSFPAFLGDRGVNSNSGIGPFRPAIWVGEDQFDFSILAHDFEKILRADPRAMVIVRFNLDVPRWWEKQHPEACCQLPDGSTLRQCFASETWRKETGEALQRCIQWLLNSPFAQHLIGIHIAAGFTEEWFYHFRGQFYDENPVRTEAFRQWLREKYADNIPALQKAWSDNRIDFSTAQPADISGKVKRQEWRDAAQEQNVIDTFRFHAETMATNIAWFCKIVKKVSKNRLLTGAFYGYHYYVTDPRRGHGALAKLLDCPDLDYLSSPNVYRRVIGEDWPPMAAVRSVQLHGKLWLAENDTRTCLTTLLKDRAPDICPQGQYENGVWIGPPDIKTSVALLWKDAVRMLTHGYGGWWFDMWGGWFSDPRLLKVLKLTQQFDRLYPPPIKDKMKAEVLVIVDEELSFWDASFGKLTGKILANRYALAKTGAPYDLYLRSDLSAVSTDHYRVIWLMGLLQLNDEEKKSIQNWRKHGVTVLWTDGYGTRIFHGLNRTQDFEQKLEWSAAQLQRIWRDAGVHLYLETNDVLYAGRDWLGIHTIQGGRKTIHLPFPAKIIDPIKQQVLADSCQSLQIKLPPGSTTLLRVISIDPIGSS